MSNQELMKIVGAAGMITAVGIEEINEDLEAIDLAEAEAIGICSMEGHAAADLEAMAINIEDQTTDIGKAAEQEIVEIFNDLYT